MKSYNPAYYQNHTFDELVNLLCLLSVEANHFKQLLRDLNYDMTTPLPSDLYENYYKLKAANHVSSHL